MSSFRLPRQYLRLNYPVAQMLLLLLHLSISSTYVLCFSFFSFNEFFKIEFSSFPVGGGIWHAWRSGGDIWQS